MRDTELSARSVRGIDHRDTGIVSVYRKPMLWLGMGTVNKNLPFCSFCWQEEMVGSQKAESITTWPSGDSRGLGCRCRTGGGDFRTLSLGRARRERAIALPEPIRILEGGPHARDALRLVEARG